QQGRDVMTLDIERLRGVVAWAKQEAKKGEHSTWDQSVWAWGVTSDRFSGGLQEADCGTAFCIAGKLCADAGDTFVISAIPRRPGDPVALAHVIPAGETASVFIEARARKLLGTDDTGSLFDGGNDINDVIVAAKELAAKHGM